MKFLLLIILFLILTVSALGNVKITLEPKIITKGNCAFLKVESPSAPELYFENFMLPVFPVNNYYMAIIPVDIDEQKNKAYIELIINKVSHLYTVHFKTPSIRKRVLYIPTSKIKYSKPSQEKLDADALVAEARKKVSPELYLDGKFIYPIRGMSKSTHYFGDLRTVKRGKATSHYYHRGIDYGAEEGRSIYAANAGKVLLARNLYTRGNAVFIDHGWGIITEYLHMSKILVKEGQMVQKGTRIGRVGNTGISTGAHLHWSVLVNGMLVNPLFWIENQILFD